MKTTLRARQAAFTMVEIALALAVIGFALVAIVGVLPMGLEVQKQNREDTFIDHDANYFLDALRNGARGLDDLTNYVYEIRRVTQAYGPNTNALGPAVTNVFTYNTPSIDPACTPFVVPGFPIDRGSRIIGLLGWPKYQLNPDPQLPGAFLSNNVVAYVRALSGAATEKFPQSNPAVRDLAFGYRLTSEVTALPMPVNTNSAYVRNLQANLHEVRLLFRWPVLPRGVVGAGGREIYRTQFGGQHDRVSDTNQFLYFFRPTLYQKR
jgi:type II secretory pathway pseudopilin PulG